MSLKARKKYFNLFGFRIGMGLEWDECPHCGTWRYAKPLVPVFLRLGHFFVVTVIKIRKAT